MPVREKITDILKKALHSAEERNTVVVPNAISVSVRPTENGTLGDYTTTLPFQLSKAWGVTPEKAGEMLKIALLNHAPKNFFTHLEIVKGFLNMRLHEDAYTSELSLILKQKEKYGQGAKKKTSVNLEFISGNPTGLLTLGNGRGAFLGDTLAKILTTSGVTVNTEYYVNNGKASTQIKELGKTALGAGTTYLTPYVKKKISILKSKLQKIKKNKKLKNPEGEAGYLLANEVQKENKQFIEKKLKVKFDTWFQEESLYKKHGLHDFVIDLKKRNIAYEKDGALWFRASEFGDSEDRVLVRNTGEPTYFLPDLMYHWDKLEKRKFNIAINIWGADHHGYAIRLGAGLKGIGIDQHRMRVIITQFVRLVKDGKEVKMSKRSGQFVLLDELIDEVGIDAARFFFLMHAPDTHMDFDMTLAKERSNKNPVYYAQYSYARIGSILRKAGVKKRALHLYLLNAPEEIALIKKLIQFPEIIEDTAKDFHALRLTTYILDLSRLFHSFYEKHRVIGDDQMITASRLALVSAVKI
ncbi:MAG: arginine--tRNA ligase, partial [Patescibacteria group bacterium]